MEESKSTKKEILRQQLELLAERSKSCDDSALAPITEQMIHIVSYLSPTCHR